eukprot:11180163-Lingulodinium_polyedra.AAC.1
MSPRPGGPRKLSKSEGRTRSSTRSTRASWPAGARATRNLTCKGASRTLSSNTPALRATAVPKA